MEKIDVIKKVIDVEKEWIPTYSNDSRILANYASYQLFDDLISTFYSYYKHDILKLSKLSEQIARLIEHCRDMPKFQLLRSYCDDTFKERIILMLRYNSKVYKYTAHDVIYTVRSFIYHGGSTKTRRIDILRKFFLGLQCDVILCITFNNLMLYSNADLKMKSFEREELNINHHKIPIRDSIILSIFSEAINLFVNKKISDISVSCPPEGFVFKSDQSIVSNIQKYYKKFDPSKLDGNSSD